jgi:hypothetical protein
MAKRVEDEATIIDANPQGSAGELRAAGKKLPGPVALPAKKRETIVVDASAGDPPLRRSTEHGNELARVGGEDEFILAWGRSNAAVKSRGRQLLMSTCLNVCMVGVIGYLAWRNEQKATYVFVRDSLGNVVQADAQSFLHAGDSRTEAEIKGYMRRWVLDAYSWTPLDVEDRLRAALRLVENKAQPAVKAALNLGERKRLVENGTSGRVHEGKETGKEAQVVITRSRPLEVMVGFDRYLIERSGATTESGHVFLRAHLKEVPRSPGNPSGLLIVDTEISEPL